MKYQRNKILRRALLVALGLLLFCQAGFSQDAAFSPTENLRQVTTHPAVDLAPRLSPDSKWLAYVSQQSGNYDIWLKNMQTGYVRQLTTHKADEFYPVWDQKNRYLIYVSQQSDVNGDLYRLNLRSVRGELIPKGEPERLTNYMGFDGYPTMSAYDEHIAWVSDRTGRPEIWLLTKRSLDVRQLTHGGATHPAWSPIQDFLAYTSFRQDGNNGDIWLINLYAPLELVEKKSATDSLERPMWPITKGLAADGFPTWTKDAKAVVFTRHDLDSNGDDFLSPADRSVLWSVDVAKRPFDSLRTSNPSFEIFRDSFDERIAQAAKPLTPAYYDARQPTYGNDGKIYFLSEVKGNADVWSFDYPDFFTFADDSLPALALIQQHFPLPRQLNAEQLDDIFRARLTPFNSDEQRALWDRQTALLQVANADTSSRKTRAQALYETGICYLLLGEPERADLYFNHIVSVYANSTGRDEQAAWADLVLLSRKSTLANVYNAAVAQALISAIETMQQKYHDVPLFLAKTDLLLGDLWAELGDVEKAIAFYSDIESKYGDNPELCAESQVLLGKLYARTGEQQAALRAFMHVLQDYHSEEDWAITARDELVQLFVADAKDNEERLARYQALYQQFSQFKTIAVEPLFRSAELLTEMGNFAQALETCDFIIAEYRDQPEVTFRARMERTELLLRTGEFIQAVADLDSMTKDYAESQPGLAARAKSRLIELLLVSANDLNAAGNYAIAAVRFQRVLEMDSRNLLAHQGYIEARFYLGDIDAVIKEYELLNEQHADDNILLYAEGLAWSWRGAPLRNEVFQASKVRAGDLSRSNELISQALSFDYNFIQAYLTLSFNFEMLENHQTWRKNKPKSFLYKAGDAIASPFVWLFNTVTFYNEAAPPRYYESAIQILTSALALNDETKNPDLEAQLALNMANNYYNLGEFGFQKAYDFYHLRMRYDSTFVDENEEARIKERMGHCAMVVNDQQRGPGYLQRAIEIYRQMNRQDLVLVNTKRLALLYEFGDNSEEALVYYQQAAEMEAQRNFYDGLLRSYRSLAFHNYLLNNSAEAVLYANKALAMLDSGLVKRSKGKALRPQLGFLGIYFPVPLDLRKFGAKSVLQLTTDEEEAIIYTILAETYRQNGNYNEAIAFYEKKLAIYEQRFDYDAQAIFQNNMAYLYFIQGDYDNAWKWFTNSYWMSRRTKNIGAELLNIVNAAHVVLTVAEEPNDRRRVNLAKYHNWITGTIRELLAATAAEEALYSQHRTHLYMLLADLLLIQPQQPSESPDAGLLLSLRSLTNAVEADTLLTLASKLAGASNYTEEMCSIHYKKGEVALLLGDKNSALRDYLACRQLAAQQGFTELLWRVNTAIGELLARPDFQPDVAGLRNDPLAYFQEAMTISEANRHSSPGISAARLRQLYQEPYRAAIQLLIERSSHLEALRLAERMRERTWHDLLGEEKLQLGDERRRQFYVQLDSLWQQLRAAELAVDAATKPAVVRELRQQQAGLKSQYETLLTTVRQEAPDIERLVRIAPAEVLDAQKLLGDSTTVLYHIAGENESYFWLINSDSITFTILPMEKKIALAELDNTFKMDSLAAEMPAAFAALFEKVSSDQPASHLVFIPDYDFLLFPWTMLLQQSGHTQVSLAVCSGLTGFLTAQQHSRMHGNTLYWAQVSPVDSLIDLSAFVVLSPMPGQSGNVFAAQLPVIAQADLLHIAGALDWSDINPSGSSLVYEIPNSQPAFVRAQDLYALKGDKTAHIIFSLLGQFEPSPDVFIAWERALYYSGISSFLLSLWPADSSQTFYQEFYKNLPGLPFAQAAAFTSLTFANNNIAAQAWGGQQLYGAGLASFGSKNLLASRTNEIEQRAIAALRNKEWRDAFDLYSQLVESPGLVAEQLNSLDQQRLVCAVNGGLWDAAIDQQEEYTERQRRLNNWPAVANATRLTAVFYEQKKDNRRAESTMNAYNQVVRQYGLEADPAAAYLQVAALLEQGENYRRAIDLIEQAAQKYRQQNDLLNYAKNLQHIGRLYSTSLSNDPAAIEYFQQALATTTAQQSPALQTELLLESGRSYLNIGAFGEATMFAERALKSAQDLTTNELVNAAWLLLAEIAAAQGDITAANDHLEKIVAPAPKAEIDVPLLRGHLLAEQGFYAEALSAAENAAQLGQNRQNAGDQPKALFLQAIVAWQQGQLDDAVLALEQILRLGNNSAVNFKAHYMLGAVLSDKQEAKRAEQELNIALDLARAHDNAVGVASCRLLLGSITSDRTWLESALALADSLALPEVAWRAWWQMAKDKQFNDATQAEQAFQAALARLLSSAPFTDFQNYRRGFSANEEQFFRDLIHFYLQSGNQPAALAALNAQQARAFMHYVAVNPHTAYSDAATRAKIRQLKDQRAFAHARLIAEKSQPPGLFRPSRFTQLAQDVSQAAAELAASQPPSFTDLGRSTESLAAIQASLPENTAILQYYYAADSLYVWSIMPDTVALAQIPFQPDVFDQQIMTWNQQLNSEAPASEIAAALYNELLAPVAARLADSTALIIIPYGKLYDVPFAALQPENGLPLGLTRRLSYSTSLALAARSLAGEKITDSSQNRPVMAITSSERENHAGDSFAANVAASLPRYFTNISVKTADNLSAANGGANERAALVYLGCTVELNPRYPYQAGLYFSAKMDENNWVSLKSASSSNDYVFHGRSTAGPTFGGAEIAGFYTALLAGAGRSVLSPQWSYNELANAVLLKRYFRLLSQGIEQAEALRQAQLLVHDEINPHPAAWAGYRLFGDFR